VADVGGVDRDTVERWLAAHDEAWRSGDPAAIGELFAEDGVYHLGPFEGPWRGMDGPLRGRPAIVAGWLAGTDLTERFTATSELLAIDGRRAVVARVMTYLTGTDEPAERYGSVWVIDFDDAGRCVDYQEWFVADERLAAQRSAVRPSS
jgi:ketosteroid isomerase-like protein